jgi:hypothetical protein
MVEESLTKVWSERREDRKKEREREERGRGQRNTVDGPAN